MQIVPELEHLNQHVSVYEINIHDQFVGKEGSEPLIWDGITPPLQLQDLIDPGIISVYDINDQGQLILELHDFAGNRNMGVWRPSSGILIADPPGLEERIWLSDINNAGIVAGSIDREGTSLPFLWNVESDEYTWLPIPSADLFAAANLEGLQVNRARANWINDHGDVMLTVSVAVSTLGAGAGVLRLADGRMLPLGSIPVPEGVSEDLYSLAPSGFLNNRRQVVETGYIFGDPLHPLNPLPFIWDEHKGVQLLSDLLDDSADGWERMFVSGLNDFGYITGWGRSPGGATHAILLVPVPEPATLSLLAMSGILVVAVAVACRLARITTCG
jgi:hypothetical protein